MTTAIVVEDDTLTRLTLVSALEKAEVDVIGDAASSADAIELSKSLHPNVALLDLHLGIGPTGVDVAHAFRRLDPSIGIVFLTSYQDPRLLHGKMPPLPAGSVYLVKKDVESIDALTNAINEAQVHRRGKSQPSIPTAMTKLTSNQIEILKLVAQGFSNAEIAKRRFIRESSVEMAINRIAKSLNLSPDVTKNNRVHMANVYFRAIGMQLDA